MGSVTEKRKEGWEVLVGDRGLGTAAGRHAKHPSLQSPSLGSSQPGGRFLKEGRQMASDGRPIITADQLLSDKEGWRSRQVLLTAGEFLKVVKAISGHAADRRTVQFYSNPGLRLLPLPVYRIRHTAHYLHPEHTKRLAVLLQLRRKYFFPIPLLRNILSAIHPAMYGLILRDGLSAQDILALARSGGSWITARDLIFRRVARLLEAANSLGRPGACELMDGPDIQQAMARFGSYAQNESRAAW